MTKRLIIVALSVCFISALFLGANLANAGFCYGSRESCAGTGTISVNSNNPLSQINYVDINNGSQNATLLIFDLNITGNAYLKKITFNSLGSTTVPTGYHLFHGPIELGYRAASGTVITFDNLQDTGTSTLYSLRVDMPATAPNETKLAVNIASAHILTNGLLVPVSGGASGNYQYFYHATPNMNFISANAVTSTSTSAVLANFNLSVMPFPGSAVQYKNTDFFVLAKKGTSSVAVSSQSITIIPTPTNNTLSAGQVYQINLSSNFNAGTLSPGVWAVYITIASSTVKDANGSNVRLYQWWGLDNWHTQSFTVGS